MKMNLQIFAAKDVDANTTLAAALKKVQNVDFVSRFESGIENLKAMLGVVRIEPVNAGEVLKAYKVVGTLESGAVAEGDVIPLSKYETTYTAIGEATLKKWRREVTAEAIGKRGAAQAVNDTNNKMLNDVQRGIRTDLITFVGTGTATATGTTLQAAIAQTWAKLQVLWEDTAIESVYFINPLTLADYLGTAQITLQTAFGLSYIENFLGMGTVILSSEVPADTVYGTAVENIVLYYIDMNAGDLKDSFKLTTDETGLIGISTSPKNGNAAVEVLVMSGTGLYAERLGGVVVGTVAEEAEAEAPGEA